MLWLTNIRIGSNKSSFDPVCDKVFEIGGKPNRWYIANTISKRNLRIERLTNRPTLYDYTDGEELAEEISIPNVFMSASAIAEGFAINNYPETFNAYANHSGNRSDVMLYITINADEFMPIFYTVDQSIIVRETCMNHRTKQYALNISLKQNEAGFLKGSIQISGFDPRDEKPDFKCIEITIGEETENEMKKLIFDIEELELEKGQIKNLKVRYNQKKYPCIFKIDPEHLSPQFYCGVLPEVEARKEIDQYLRSKDINIEYEYRQIPELVKGEEVGYRKELVERLSDFCEMNMRGIVIVGESNIPAAVGIKLGLHYILRLDGQSIKTTYSN